MDWLTGSQGVDALLRLCWALEVAAESGRAQQVPRAPALRPSGTGRAVARGSAHHLAEGSQMGRDPDGVPWAHCGFLARTWGQACDRELLWWRGAVGARGPRPQEWDRDTGHAAPGTGPVSASATGTYGITDPFQCQLETQRAQFPPRPPGGATLPTGAHALHQACAAPPASSAGPEAPSCSSLPPTASTWAEAEGGLKAGVARPEGGQAAAWLCWSGTLSKVLPPGSAGVCLLRGCCRADVRIGKHCPPATTPTHDHTHTPPRRHGVT